MQTDDRQVAEMLAKFTLLPLATVEEVAAEHAGAPERRAGQRRLAREVTTIVHGADAAAAADAASVVLFGGSPLDADAAALEAVAAEVPRVAVDRQRLLDGVGVVELLVEGGAVTSKGEARRLVAQRGVRVNGEVVDDGRQVEAGDLLHGRFVLLRRGKDGYLVVEAPPG
jgi:tyrosyl-tRNA synthetase